MEGEILSREPIHYKGTALTVLAGCKRRISPELKHMKGEILSRGPIQYKDTALTV